MAKKRKRAGKDAPAITRPADKTDTTDKNELGAKTQKAAAEPKPSKAAEPKPAKSSTPSTKRDDLESRSFWFGYEIAWAKLLVARFVIFGLLAVDALLQISHAPRYGAGGFNVAHVPGLDDLGAGRPSFAIAQLVIAYLLVFAALGVRTRIVLPIATALYAWLYFGSQLDSYQHHYLVALVLLIACFVPWERPAGATPSTPVRSWAVRLMLVQLGIMYLWAAISKMDPAWLDGRTLELQISGTMREIIDESVGIRVASRFALIVELVLAVTIWSKRTWFVALPVGIAFHVGIFASGLEIGLFAVLMLGFYLLVIPDRLFAEAGELFVGLAGGLVRAIGRALASGLGIGLMLVAGYVLALFVRLPAATVIGLVLVTLCAAWIGFLRVRRSSNRDGTRVIAAGLTGAHVVALLVWLVVDRASSTAVDYYRFWGGNARRLGDPVASEYAYRKVIEIDPEQPAGHYQLGQILLGRGDEVAGLARLHEAQRLEPARARAFLAEARYLQSKGRAEAALVKAKEATYAQPDHPQAQQFLRSLSGPAEAAPDNAGDTNDND
jgi:hypothetical protein